jgi:L-amino acid N-acyltransferase YncA
MGTLVIRAAEPPDAPLVMLWRNDATTRAMARRHGEVSVERVAEWLAEPGETFIGLVDGEPFGVLKFTSAGGYLWPVINLDPERRGQGLSRSFLCLALDCLRSQGHQKFRACIRHENVRSLRLFQGAGFRSIPAPVGESAFAYLEAGDGR